jgi:hypothetical protein
LKKKGGKLAILLNPKNNVLPWSEDTHVAGEEYPIREHFFKRDRRLCRRVLSEGPKKERERETSSAECREKEFLSSQSSIHVN